MKNSALEDVMRNIINEIKGMIKNDYWGETDIIINNYLPKLEEIIGFCKKGSKILDVGSAYGHIPATFAYLGYDSVGIDIPKTYVDLWDFLERKYGCSILSYDDEKLPFTDNYFDCVTTFGVLEHVDEESSGKVMYDPHDKFMIDLNFLNEINRVLKPSAYFFVYDLPNHYSYIERVAKILGIWHHPKRYTREETYALLKPSMFSVVKEYYTGMLPKQLGRINPRIERFILKYYRFYTSLDNVILHSPLRILSSNLNFICMKK